MSARPLYFVATFVTADGKRRGEVLVRRFVHLKHATIWFNRNFNLETREEDPEVWDGMFDVEVEGGKVGETVKAFVIMDYEKFLKDGRIIKQGPARAARSSLWSWSLFRRKPPTPPMPVPAPTGTGSSGGVLTGGRRKSRRVKKRHASRRARTRTRRSRS